jgi:DNA-binding transcriptional LysR family regulator
MEHRGPQVDLNELLVFARVVQGGSLTAAASALGMPKSTVSRKLAELEARLGARLLQRTTRTLSLTDVGRAYYEHCARVLAEVEEAEQAITRLQATPRGALRVTAPLAFNLLGPVVSTFLERYPEVELELVCTDRRVDLVEERFDVGIRAGPMADSSLVSRRLGALCRVLVAAPSLLKRVGVLRGPTELEHHDCLVFGAATEGTQWKLSHGSEQVELHVRARLVVNDYELLQQAARAGSGFALLPEWACAGDLKTGTLKRVLPDWSTPEIPVHAVYPNARHLSPKTLAFLEVLKERFRPGR